VERARHATGLEVPFAQSGVADGPPKFESNPTWSGDFLTMVERLFPREVDSVEKRLAKRRKD
jgi:hypothetical protein